jgi:thiol-disulfide isomerase/thioredoxin
MKWLCTALSCFIFAYSVQATDEADRAWAQIAQTGQTNGGGDQLANQLKKFYTKYPAHPKAADAWIKEQTLRKKTAGPDLKKLATPSRTETKTEDAPSLRERVQEAEARIRKAQLVSVAAGLGEMERCGRKLATDFPRDPAGWRILMTAAAGFGGTKAQQLYNDVVANAPTDDLKITALTRLSEIGRKPMLPAKAAPQQVQLPYIGPVNLAFTDIDGRDVNLARLGDKVTLIHFWATWCPACRSELPKIRTVYDEFNAQGFEIIGVSFDDNQQMLRAFSRLYRLSWPQFYDGGGWDNAVNKTFGIKQLPTMYLVDKRGLLRDRMAGENLRDKVWSLLQE